MQLESRILSHATNIIREPDTQIPMSRGKPRPVEPDLPANTSVSVWLPSYIHRKPHTHMLQLGVLMLEVHSWRYGGEGSGGRLPRRYLVGGDLHVHGHGCKVHVQLQKPISILVNLTCIIV
jgi:hypothetical protein